MCHIYKKKLRLSEYLQEMRKDWKLSPWLLHKLLNKDSWVFCPLLSRIMMSIFLWKYCSNANSPKDINHLPSFSGLRRITLMKDKEVKFNEFIKGIATWISLKGIDIPKTDFKCHCNYENFKQNLLSSS